MIRRTLEPTLLKLAQQYPVVTLTGPRQSGKTTLVRIASMNISSESLFRTLCAPARLSLASSEVS